MFFKQFLFIIVVNVSTVRLGRILAVFPGTSVSHQMVFRPITQELARRGHEVYVITTDPAFANGSTPANLTEIDVHDISYRIYKEVYCKTLKGNNDMFRQTITMIDALYETFEAQFKSEAVQNLLKKNMKFDLVITEAYLTIATSYSRIFNAPGVLLSSFGFGVTNADIIGAPVNPIYPSTNRQRIVNLTIFENIYEVYREIWSHRTLYNFEEKMNSLLKELVPNAPKMQEVFDNVHSLMVNVPTIWEWNRPVPPSTIFLGWLLDKPQSILPKDLQTFLDSSEYGFIYMSFGTNVIESLLPSEKVNTFVEVFTKLPYNVVWKWNSDKLPVISEKIKFFKWVPQTDLLRHPNIKLFITHGGLHSSDEAIAAAVPLIITPMSIDQWFNAEHYAYHGIGVKLSFESITEDPLKDTILNVIINDSYRRNVLKLRSFLYDQPMRPLDLAVWWIEYILHHGGAHLRAPAANMSWIEYLEIKLIGAVLIILFIFIVTLTICIYKLLKTLSNKILSIFKVKDKRH